LACFLALTFVFWCLRGEPLDKAVATRPVDVVVASDCLYESASHSALLSTLLELTAETAVSQHHVVVLLAYKQRMPAWVLPAHLSSVHAAPDRGCVNSKEKLFFETAATYFDVAILSKDARSNPSNSTRGHAVEYFDEAIYICKLERLPQGGSR